MVYICTKLARQMDQEGMDSMFAAAKTATSLMEEAKPLLDQVGFSATGQLVAGFPEANGDPHSCSVARA